MWSGLDDMDVDMCEVRMNKAANLKFPELVQSVNWEDIVAVGLKSIVSCSRKHSIHNWLTKKAWDRDMFATLHI